MTRVSYDYLTKTVNYSDPRFRPAGEFPYLVLYVEGVTEIDVWRVLHGARDIPIRMREPDER